MNYASIDIETCGLQEKTHTILEFGCVLDNLKNPLFIDKLERFHCYFISENYVGSPYALSLHSKIFKRIEERQNGFTYVNPMKFGYMFKKFLINNGYKEEKGTIHINVAGKNFGSFDEQFLKEQTDLFKHVKIRHRLMDPGILYWKMGDEALPGTEECKKRAGLEEMVAHTAIEDAIDVIKLIRFKMLGFINE